MSSKNPACGREDLIDLARDVLSDYTGGLKSRFSNMSFIYKQIKHRNDAESGVSSAYRSLGRKIEKKLNVEMGIRHSEFRDKISDIKNEMYENREMMKVIENERRKIDEEVEALKQEREEKKKRMQRDLNLWKRLKDRFQEAFGQEVESRTSRIASGVPNKEKVLLALYLHQIKKDYDAMMEGSL